MEEPVNDKPMSREELLVALVEILEDGYNSHTDAVNELSALLHEEADKEPDAPWAQGYFDMTARMT